MNYLLILRNASKLIKPNSAEATQIFKRLVMTKADRTNGSISKITTPQPTTPLTRVSGFTGPSPQRRWGIVVNSTRHLGTQTAVQNPPPKKKVMTKLTEAERNEKLQPLLNAGWSLVNGRDAIYKEYLFTDFNQAFSFMTAVALLAEKTNHHPEWFNVYNKVQVTMSTHDVGGLSAKDIRAANFMEAEAKRFL